MLGFFPCLDCLCANIIAVRRKTKNSAIALAAETGKELGCSMAIWQC